MNWENFRHRDGSLLVGDALLDAMRTERRLDSVRVGKALDFIDEVAELTRITQPTAASIVLSAALAIARRR